MSLTLDFDCPAEQAAVAAQAALEAEGLQVVRTFDLPAAEWRGRPCAIHHSDTCRCRLTVLLVYPASGTPAAVMAQGGPHATRLEVASDPNSPPDGALFSLILRGLASARDSLRARPR